MKTGTSRWLLGVFVMGAALKVSSGAEATGLASAIKAAAEGHFPEPAVVEVEGSYKKRLQAVKLFSTGVGIANNQTQFVVPKDTVKSVFKALDRYGFASMPEQFGGRPRPTNKPEMRSAVTVRIGSWEKTVTQMRDGEQSKRFAKLVSTIFSNVEASRAQGVSVATLQEGLKAIVEGKLAPETLSFTLAWEEHPKAFAVFAVSGLYVRWTPAGGGDIKRYWLGGEKARELAKLLLALEPDQRSARFYWPTPVCLAVSVLNQHCIAEGLAWAGSVGERERAFAARWESVNQELRRVLKEAMLER
ncbi:MAG: hypothetical protein ACK42L_01630 [Thermoanaerobaculum sp.]